MQPVAPRDGPKWCFPEVVAPSWGWRKGFMPAPQRFHCVYQNANRSKGDRRTEHIEFRRYPWGSALAPVRYGFPVPGPVRARFGSVPWYGSVRFPGTDTGPVRNRKDRSGTVTRAGKGQNYRTRTEPRNDGFVGKIPLHFATYLSNEAIRLRF